MTDTEARFNDWLLEIEIPQLSGKFPEVDVPRMTLHGQVFRSEEEACPEVKQMFEAMIGGLETAGYKARLVLTETVTQ